MVPIENQERPNIKSVYTCSNCEKALFDGDDDHPRWNFCPMCGQEIEWDKSAKVVWEEKTVISVAVGLLSATLQVFGMPQATITVFSTKGGYSRITMIHMNRSMVIK